MRLLFIGDITGGIGRKFVAKTVETLIAEHQIDLAIANVDNAAHGLGVTGKIARQIVNCGVEVLTGGNHLFDRKEIMEEIEDLPMLLRGANYSGDVPGQYEYVGVKNGTKFHVTHFIGRTFMGSYENPFLTADRLLEKVDKEIHIRIVDFHAEATSEKLAFARYLDGRVSAVIGTHTHVQTADEQILPGGTAFITDVGMSGPHDGIIGMKTDSVLPRFLTGLPTRFEPAENEVKLHAVVIDIDDSSGKAKSIERIRVNRDH